MTPQQTVPMRILRVFGTFMRLPGTEMQILTVQNKVDNHVNWKNKSFLKIVFKLCRL